MKEYLKSFLPSADDEFHDGSDHEDSQNQMVAQNMQGYNCDSQKNQKRREIMFERNEGNKQNVIEIDDGSEIEAEEIYDQGGQIDEEELNYYKEKLGLMNNEEQEEKLVQIVTEPIRFVPPVVEMKAARKLIHEYPPYVLGPRDVWPPKYPNSMRQFKRQMREQRKLK